MITEPAKRVRLEKGKEYELIQLAKTKSGLSWRQLGKKIGISPNYLRNELRRGHRTLSGHLFDSLCVLAGKDFSDSIIEILDRNWGRALGGRNSPTKLSPKPKVPVILTTEHSVEMAEFLGILCGDGHCYELPSKGIYQVRIFGHLKDEHDYMTEYVFGLFKKLFNIEPAVYFRKRQNVIILSKQSKDLVHTVKNLGFKQGNKTTNGISIPPWIFENQNFLKSFIRGLIDTDGCVYPKTKNHKTPTIWFTSASPNLRNSFNKAVQSLGFPFSKWTKRKNMNGQQCSMGNAGQVLRYYSEIGFSNEKHITRFQRFCNAPIVQPG